MTGHLSLSPKKHIERLKLMGFEVILLDEDAGETAGFCECQMRSRGNESVWAWKGDPYSASYHVVFSTQIMGGYDLTVIRNHPELNALYYKSETCNPLYVDLRTTLRCAIYGLFKPDSDNELLQKAMDLYNGLNSSCG